jgi:hypothetical protein
MQATVGLDHLQARAEEKMEGVAEDDLRTDLAQRILP